MVKDVASIMERVASSKSTHRTSCQVLANMMNKDASTVFEGLLIALCRVVGTKKDNSQAQLLSKFLGSFLDFLTKDDDGFSNQLAEFLLKSLIVGIESGQKLVRVRITQFIHILLNYLDEIDDAVFMLLRTKLIERSRDKEIQVRVVAVIALCRLQDEDEDVELVDNLVFSMQYDPSALVRRNIVEKITLTNRVKPYFIQRVSDVDSSVRLAVYRKIAEEDHFEIFSIEERLFLLKNGLNDRNLLVSKECGEMLRQCWMRLLDNNVLRLIHDLDVVKNYNAVKLCLLQVFSAEKKFEWEFDANFWNNLTPEKVVYLRVYTSYCLDNSLLEEYDVALPELVLHVQYLKKYTAWMVSTEDDSKKMDLEVIIFHLLNIVLGRDFSDEVGRRELQLFLRTFLVNTDVDEDCLQVAIKSLDKSSAGEMDFLRIVTDILFDIEDVDPNDTESPEEQDVSHSIRTLKCLDIIKSAFTFCRTVNHLFSIKSAESNEPMNALLERFVLPALQSTRMAIRSVAIECLGMVCLLSKQMAIDNFKLFEYGFNSNDHGLVEMGLKIILDLFIIHGFDVFDTEESPNVLNKIIRKAMSCQNEEIVILAAKGAAKMFLLWPELHDKDILTSLFCLYYNPIPSAEMKKLRQFLSYFVESYCKSSYQWQKRVQEIFMHIVRFCEETKAHVADILPINQIILHLIDWTDYRRLMQGKPDKCKSLHYSMAKDIAEYARAYHSVRRSLCSCLAKFDLEGLYQNEKDTYDELVSLTHDLLEDVDGDAVSRNAVKRFSKMLSEMKESLELDNVEQEEVERLTKVVEQVEGAQIIQNEEEEVPLDEMASLHIQK